MRAIGLDLGTKSLGIAITDSNKIVVSGIDNYFYPEKQLSYCLKRVKEIIQSYKNNFDLIVLGYPTRHNNVKTKMTFFVESFYQLLKEEFKEIKIVLWDEKVSTQDAIQTLRNCEIKKSKFKKIKDKLSAVYILEDYLALI